jgi:hypothetical protein
MNSHRVNWSHYAEPAQSLEYSVSEKLALYGSSSLSGVEHLRLLIGTDALVDALLRHFGSLKALSRASFKELRQFLPRRKAVTRVTILVIRNLCLPAPGFFKLQTTFFDMPSSVSSSNSWLWSRDWPELLFRPNNAMNKISAIGVEQ